MHSNFITPPDFVNDDNYSVLVIDATWDEVETIALWCQSASNQCYNVYLYNDLMDDREWLSQAISCSNAIVMNTVESNCQEVKNTLVKDSRMWYYGPSRYLANTNRLEKPLDFFVQHNER